MGITNTAARCSLLLCGALLLHCAEARQLPDRGPFDSSLLRDADLSTVDLDTGYSRLDLDSLVKDPLDLVLQNENCAAECAGKCKGESDGCGRPCPVNQCHGCCKNNKCVKGDLTLSCGTMGEACSDCTVTDECKEGACESSKCVKKARPEEHKCSGGVCRAGSCCKGCWKGGACKGGISNDFCGFKGILCSACTTTNPCHSASCISGNCVTSWRPFGWGCPGGKCLHGSCCPGCVSNSTCHNGTAHGNCGKGGNPCQSCWWNQNCNNGMCN